MTTTYRYLFADLLTNAIIGELPLTGVSFTQQLNSAGTLSGHLQLAGLDSEAFNVDTSTTPGRNAIYVDRDGTLVWGGIIWGREYNSSDQTLSFTAREFESYLEHRRITSTTDFNNIDQLAIVQSLVSTMQGITNGDIGILIGTETSGVLVDRTFYGYEFKTVYSALQDLSRSDDGFDFNINLSYSGGTPIKTLALSYPRSGVIYSASDSEALVFEFPSSNIVEYVYPEDGSLVANTVYASGAGSNEGKISSTQSSATQLAAGYPVLETQVSYSDITDQTLLTNLALGQLTAVLNPPVTMRIVVPPFQEPLFGTYDIGDDARIRILDDRFPTQLDTTFRIVAFSVTPGEDGPERVTITLTEET